MKPAHSDLSLFALKRHKSIHPNVQDCPSSHPPPHVGEGQGGPEPGRHSGGPLQGAEGQTGGAITPQRAEPVHQHLVGGRAQRTKATELMEVMLASLLPGEQHGKLFKAIFLHRLPGDLKYMVAVQSSSWKPWSWPSSLTSSGTPGTPRRWWWGEALQLRRTALLWRRWPWRGQWRLSQFSARRSGSLDIAGAVAG